MAEKPRLKKSDEILGSIAAESARTQKRAGASSRLENVNQQGRGKERQPAEPKVAEPKDIDFEYDDSEEIELNDQPVLPSAQTLAQKLMERDEKRRQLNFEKYELPKRAPVSAPTAEFDFGDSHADDKPAARPEPAPRPARTATPRQLSPEPPATAAPAPPSGAAPVSFEQNSSAAPVVAEYTFQSFDDRADEPVVREFQMSSGTSPEPRRPARTSRRGMPQTEEEPDALGQEFVLDLEPKQAPVQQASPRIIARARAPLPGPEPAFEYDAEPVGPASPRRNPKPAPPQNAAPPPPPEPAISEEERNRQEFLKRISNQFEIQFDEEFGRGTINSRASANHTLDDEPPARAFVEPAPPRKQPEPRFEPEPPTRRPEPETRRETPPEEDFLSYVQRQEEERQERERQDRERASARAAASLAAAKPAPRPDLPEDEAPALDFINKFQRDIRQEEEQRSEEFKEALSQKFMRERERYLKDLGISEPEAAAAPDVPAASQPRRKLDFQIQPEMHMRDGAPSAPRPASGPMTYTRGGAAKPQVAENDAPDAPASLPPALSRLPSQPRAQAPSDTRKTAEQLLLEHTINTRSSVAQQPHPKPAKLNFNFSVPNEQSPPRKKDRDSLLPQEKWPRRIIMMSMVAGLFAIGLLAWPLVRYVQLTNQLSGGSSEPVSAVQPVSEDTLNVYNDLSYNETAHASNVMFKNANVTLRNVNVSDYVVIEGIDTSGKIRLEDVSVNSAISVKACRIDTLELHNVKAARVIINNPGTEMTVSATGSTSVDVVELRTTASVRQSDSADGSDGLRGVVILPADPDRPLTTKLSGLRLATLESNATDSELIFENETRAESMSAYGSLSLSGSGRVTNLSIGAKTGQGAGDIVEGKDVRLLVKDVAINSLNVKSPADLNLATSVDNVSTSDSIMIGGSGSVGTLTLNPGATSGRLLVDVAGLNIQNIYSNTPSRINVTGSAKVNFLTADASTYALGNKVNHLIANANGVIYENEPDNKTISSGVNPPQSKAENPNIDYNLGTASTIVASDGGDSVATCGHSREIGGFLRGAGSKDSPFEVATPLQLAHVSAHLSSHFLQISELDMSSESAFATGFPMIGSSSDPFTGTYNGNGSSISKLRIISTSDNVGLFAFNQGGIIQNVRILSGEISANSTSRGYVGAIAGLNSDGGSIRSCSNGATVIGNQNTYTGGITGYNFGGRVHDCYNYAKISGVDTVGGLVGYNRQSGAVTGSYNVGAIDGRDYVGSVAGQNEGSTIANCYFLFDTAPEGIGAGSGTALERSAEELQDPQMAADLAAGNESSLWTSPDPSSSYSFPILKKPSLDVQ